MPRLRRILSAAARLLQHPVTVTLFIGSLGIVLGIPLGRLLQSRPWEEMMFSQPRDAATGRLQALPSQAKVANAGTKPPGNQETAAVSAGQQAARQAARAVLNQYMEWRKSDRHSQEAMPLSVMEEALALGARLDVNMVLDALPTSYWGSLIADLVLCGWADRDPESAWSYFSSQSRRHGTIQFLRRLARHHWPLIAPWVDPPVEGFASEAIQAWEQRVCDAPDLAGAWELTLQIPEGRCRSILRDRVLWHFGPDAPQAALALLAEVPESDRLYETGRLGLYLARSHPALALELVRNNPLCNQYYWVGDDYSAAEDILHQTLSGNPGESLHTLAYILRQGCDPGDRTASHILAAKLPRQMEKWLPDAVEAARGWPEGGEFLANLIGGCRGTGGAEEASLIAQIDDPALSSAAAGMWAERWAVHDPAAAREWAESLPPAARAGAMAALWKKGEPPEALLAVCSSEGILPDMRILDEMSRAAPDITLPWLMEQPGAQVRHVAGRLRAWADTAPAAAAAWAAQHPDSETRVRLVSAALDPWLKRAPSEAEAWLTTSPLSAEEAAFVTDLTGIARQ